LIVFTIMIKTFHVVIERDEEGVVVVECPELPGCVSQGRTEDEALANIREAIALSVETRRAHKLPLFAEIRSIEVEVPA
jgi:predicted RNase H-like HicB family nuclease